MGSLKQNAIKIEHLISTQKGYLESLLTSCSCWLIIPIRIKRVNQTVAKIERNFWQNVSIKNTHKNGPVNEFVKMNCMLPGNLDICYFLHFTLTISKHLKINAHREPLILFYFAGEITQLLYALLIIYIFCRNWRELECSLSVVLQFLNDFRCDQFRIVKRILGIVLNFSCQCIVAFHFYPADLDFSGNLVFNYCVLTNVGTL